MQITHFWHQYNLQSKKSLIFFCFICAIFLFNTSATAQWIGHQKTGGRQYDKYASTDVKRNRLSRKLAFGFFVAPLRSKTQVKYTNDFVNTSPNNLNGLVNIDAKASPGFALGFYANFRLSEFWDFRIHTSTSFYERTLEYRFQDGKTESKIIESTLFETPLLFKYRSQLRGTKGMYLIAGIKPSFALATRQKDEASVRIKNSDLSIEYGIGLDVFFPYFKFSPELRFSHGILNVFDSKDPNDFSRHIQKLTTHTATLYIHFGS